MKLSVMLFALLFLVATASAQVSISDLNGDGIVSALAFGDSITRGIGDGLRPGVESPENIAEFIGPGYPGRVQNLLGIPVDNEGVPGEELTTQGIFRLPGSVSRSSADYVLIFEGINDASRGIGDAEIERKLQRAINTVRLLGKEPLIGTYFATAENHESLIPIAAGYSNTVKQLALSNDCRLLDFERAFRTTCQNTTSCELLNLPDGLHPNIAGYRVMAEVVSAALLGIDIFSATGSMDLAAALNLTPAEIVTRSDAVLPVS